MSLGGEGAVPDEAGLDRAGPDDAAHLSLVQTLLEDGFALITSTILRGQTVLRTCTINPRTTEADVQASLERLDSFARKLIGL